ncbi:MAG: Rsd/AlgQ family anti-sigma factor [Gammaproteobacteria bacterium]|nr:Rsd/AlgQ family anti-sigma factor [Gammaproteobacteria bacterium]
MTEIIAEDRRVHLHQMINSLVDSRTKTLAQYKELIEYKPFVMDETLQEVLEDFCTLLVDYTAKVHFNLYNYFDEQTERRQNVLIAADTIYPKIVKNTQNIIDLHDSYNDNIPSISDKTLELCLNSIGELLAERMILENDLIAIFID